jgi:hypothetical protein
MRFVCGDVFKYPNFPFENGTTRDKYFVIMAHDDDDDEYYCLITTSQYIKKRNQKGSNIDNGCNPPPKETTTRSKNFFMGYWISKPTIQAWTYCPTGTIILTQFVYVISDNNLFESVGRLRSRDWTSLRTCLLETNKLFIADDVRLIITLSTLGH